MSTRNTLVLREVVDVLFTEVDEQTTALARLEHHFRDRPLVDAGNVATVGTYAEELRLRITADERSTVLDYIGERQMIMITVDVVETAIKRAILRPVHRTVNGKEGRALCQPLFLAARAALLRTASRGSNSPWRYLW